MEVLKWADRQGNDPIKAETFNYDISMNMSEE